MSALIWAFDKRQTVGSICVPGRYRWWKNEMIDPSQPMYILREATREEWAGEGGRSSGTEELYFYEVSTD